MTATKDSPKIKIINGIKYEITELDDERRKWFKSDFLICSIEKAWFPLAKVRDNDKSGRRVINKKGLNITVMGNMGSSTIGVSANTLKNVLNALRS